MCTCVYEYYIHYFLHMHLIGMLGEIIKYLIFFSKRVSWFKMFAMRALPTLNLNKKDKKLRENIFQKNYALTSAGDAFLCSSFLLAACSSSLLADSDSSGFSSEPNNPGWVGISYSKSFSETCNGPYSSSHIS